MIVDLKQVNDVGSIEYIMGDFIKYMPRERIYAYWYQETRQQAKLLEADVTLCLENRETGEIRELWYRRVDENTEDQVTNEAFKKFFYEHHVSLRGRKHIDKVLDSSLITERWIPDDRRRLERLALYRRVEQHGNKRLAIVVLMLEDCRDGRMRELWHTRIKMNDNVADGLLKEKLEKMVEEHYVALKGRGVITVSFVPASEDGELTEMHAQQPGPENKGDHSMKIVIGGNENSNLQQISKID